MPGVPDLTPVHTHAVTANALSIFTPVLIAIAADHRHALLGRSFVDVTAVSSHDHETKTKLVSTRRDHNRVEVTMSKLYRKALIATALLTALAGSVHAVLLNPGDIKPLPGTTVAAEPQLAGIIEVDELLPFSFADASGNISGAVQVRVVRSTVDNTVDFYWRIFNDPTSSDGINLIHVGDFNASFYDVNWRIDGLGDVAPTEGLRHFDPISNAFDFLFADLLQPGTTSNFVFIDTDAFSYARTATFHLLDLDQLSSSMIFTTYAPSTVPEAGSLALVVAGLFAIALTRRRKQ
jgi:hypothetical protein